MKTEKTKTPVKKYISLIELYLHYRYKWYNINSNTIPIPYFPKTEISEHKYKLSKQEWVKIIYAYVDLLIELIIQGETIQLPLGLGYLQMIKRKVKYDRLEGDYARFIMDRLDGYSPKVTWLKSVTNHNIVFKNKSMFSIVMIKNVYLNKVIKALKADRSLIYRYPTI